LIDSLTDQISYGSSTLRRELPKRPELSLRQLHLRSKEAHAIMISNSGIMMASEQGKPLAYSDPHRR
jgi:hypothetical protein